MAIIRQGTLESLAGLLLEHFRYIPRTKKGRLAPVRDLQQLLLTGITITDANHKPKVIDYKYHYSNNNPKL